jgi:hypothetical protein
MNTLSHSVEASMSTMLSDYADMELGQVPFPRESIVFWAYLWSLQNQENPDGGYMEIGVEHGGTAFFALSCLDSDAAVDLIDLQKTERFQEKFSMLPSRRQLNTNYHLGSSFEIDIEELKEKNYALMHIDGGHLYEHVRKDLVKFSSLVGPRTILVLDDVFEIRWPGVTEAIFEMMPDLPLKPLFFVNRKLYVCSDRSHAHYMSLAEQTINVLSNFSELRQWRVELFGDELYTVKMANLK